MIVVIAKMHGDAFVQAVDDLGMPINSEKVGPEEFLAMSHEANMGVRAQRVVRKYLLDKGLRVLPTDRAMRELGKEALLPSTKKVKIGSQVFLYSHMKLDDLVRQLVCDNYDPRMKNLKIVIGGNHGQGAFHSPIKLVFIYADKNENKSIEAWFGQVDCPTESYDIIQKRLAAPINKGLQSMMEKDLATGKTHDGRLLVDYDQAEKIDAKYAFAGELKGNQAELPFCIFISGNCPFLHAYLVRMGH